MRSNWLNAVVAGSTSLAMYESVSPFVIQLGFVFGLSQAGVCFYTHTHTHKPVPNLRILSEYWNIVQLINIGSMVLCYNSVHVHIRLYLSFYVYHTHVCMCVRVCVHVLC